MVRPLVRILLGVVAVGIWQPTVQPVRAAGAQIYVTVVDNQGKPVTDLTAADFAVELDGAPREILAAGVAVEPMSLVILTDRLGLDGNYTAFDVGRALGDFVKVIRAGSPGSKIGLVTFDGIVLQITGFTSAATALDRALMRLSTTATGAVFLEALADVCKMMRKAPTDRRIIFTVLAAYRPEQGGVRNEVAAEMLRVSKASLWTVEVRAASRGNFAHNVREVVLDAGAQMSGGTREIVASRTGLVASSQQMAALMLSQYVLNYAPAAGSPTSQLRIVVRRPGVRILAPRWTSS